VGRRGGEPAADHVDEGCQDAGAYAAPVSADLADDRHPRPARAAVDGVLERETQVAEQVIRGRIGRGHCAGPYSTREFDLGVVAALAYVEALDVSLRIDAPELVALVRVALAVECPPVARAHELVAGDVAVGEIVIEMRAPSGNTAYSAVDAAPEHALCIVELHRDDSARRWKTWGELVRAHRLHPAAFL
jgi:hypothetical protein